MKNPQLAYDISYLNADVDPEAIVGAVQLNSNLKMLLSGPPGCGKTAFARHLAQELDRGLLVYRASDLLNCYVGGTEKNIQRMFAAAEREEAVLLLDEADSFLFDRAGAYRSWERTQVNELLTQIEGFPGTFIAATNFVDVLDRALFRRFDVKVGMSALDFSQRIKLFEQCLKILNCKEGISTQVERRLSKLEGLTVGDFVTALSKVSRGLQGSPDAHRMVDALELEHSVRPDRRSRGIGFQAAIGQR